MGRLIAKGLGGLPRTLWVSSLAEHDALAPVRYVLVRLEPDLGFDRIVAPGTKVPNMLANLV